MTNDLKSYSDSYASRSDEELTVIKHHNTEWSYPHIAAKLILDERAKIEAETRHKENIKESKKSNRLARFAIFIALLSLVVAIIALFDKKKIEPKETPKLESKMPASSAVPPSNSKLPIQQETAPKDKQQK